MVDAVKLEEIKAKWFGLSVPGPWRASHGGELSEIYGGPTEHEQVADYIRDRRIADAIADAPTDIATLIEFAEKEIYHG